MILGLSLRTLLRRRGRTLLAVAGIAVAAALLLDMMMLGSGLTRSFGELSRAQGYTLRVTPAGTLPFDSEAGIGNATEVGARIAAVPGVSGLAPVLGAQLYAVRGETGGEPLFTSGIDPEAQMIYQLIDGRDPQPGEVVVSAPMAEAYDLAPGDELQLAARLDVTLGHPYDIRDFTVSGIGDFLYNYADERSLALPLTELQRMTGRTDEVSLFAVAGEEQVDEEELAARIEASVESLSVYSTRELMAAMDLRLAYFRQLATILATIALVVASLLAATIVTIGVRERFGEIATLRAIGVPSRRLQMGILVEGIVLTLTGAALGLPLGLWMAGRLDRILLTFPGIPARVSFFVLDPRPVAAALVAMMAVGALAGVVPGLRATRMPLGTALREEAD